VPNYRLDLSYDGTGFRGFARQRGVRTVQGDVETALERVFGVPVESVCAGRTDAGVHARHQVMSFPVDVEVEGPRIVRSINRMLGPEISATACAVVPDEFHARFSATWRSYRYRVLNAPSPDPLIHRTAWHVADALDLEAMDRAAAGFVGEHDFASFCRRSEGRSTTRRVVEASWSRDSALCVFAIRAGAFCHQMVRSITGFCVDAGRGRVDPDSVGAVLAARHRNAGRPMAPAHGLILWDVGYGNQSTDEQEGARRSTDEQGREPA
jgi:tRNA pseudouridine38-40 synthase